MSDENIISKGTKLTMKTGEKIYEVELAEDWDRKSPVNFINVRELFGEEKELKLIQMRGGTTSKN